MTTHAAGRGGTSAGADDATAIFVGESDMAARMRDHDWSASPLGDPASWPAALRASLALMLDTGFPMFVAWGEQLTFLYNDAYAPILGGKHPAALGQPFERIWGEIWDDISPLVDRALAGESVRLENLPLRMHRHGYDEETFFSFSYSPVRDAAGDVAGMFCACTETTELVQAATRQRLLVALSDAIRDIEEPDRLAFTAAEILGRALGVSRVGYATIDPDAETLHVARDWNAPGVETLAGTLRLRDYGSFVEGLKRGEFIAIPDVRADDRTASAAAALERRSARSFVNVPVLDRGRLRAVLYVNHAGVRHWTADELSFVREVAERTRTAVERRRVESALHLTDESLRLAVQAAAVGIWDLDLTTDLLTWSDRTKAAFGISPDVPCSMADFYAGLHPDDLDATSAAFATALDPVQRATYDVEYRTVGKEDGIVRWVAAKGIGLFDAEGRCVRALGTAIDITARKRVEETLRDLNERLEQRVAETAADLDRVWRNASDMFFVIDPDGVIARVNPATTAILGWAEAEMTGRAVFDYVHPDDVASTMGALQHARGDVLPVFENRYRARSGAYRHIAWTAAPEGTLIYAYGRDVTAEKERQAELERAQDQLRQAQKMEAVGQLTGGLAHDFNNLLTGVMGNLELLQMRMAQGRLDGAERFITAAQGAGRRAAALTQRLLAFSRRQTLDPKPTDVNRLVVGMEDLIHRSIGPAIALEIVGAAGLWTALIDPGQLENALLNLCINARDAMPDGGRLTIETANKWIDERAGRDRDLPAGQYLSVCVTDTGTGMTPETIARAFDPFFTTKPLGEGTGLGLSMIYGFARQSGGQVRVYSEVGRGTTMCIYLPRHLGDAEQPAGTEAEARPQTAAGITVLVVDDEPTVRQLVEEVLGDQGYAVLGAADGPAGLKVLQSGARVDLLITDVGLPNGMNGRQVADAARALRPGLPVLFITGYAENAAVGNGLMEAGMELLTKPFSMIDLARRVGAMLDA